MGRGALWDGAARKQKKKKKKKKEKKKEEKKKKKEEKKKEEKRRKTKTAGECHKQARVITRVRWGPSSRSWDTIPGEPVRAP